ncbi:hypothetical protein Gogos_005708 [Gossypium gossypioides]|uniref:RNase H type-1 domain-containing protein n=1 Tax=Gossypium gossypioides TaxID=34282 RepID=A0A7J9C3Q1_GOSGO|nr:hypothetical protein [Gossypium gossypioides]
MKYDKGAREGKETILGTWAMHVARFLGVSFGVKTREFWAPEKLMVDIDFGIMLDSVFDTMFSLRSTTNKIVYHWEPPPPGWMKFNVASVALEDKAGCAAVLRDDKGVACVLFYGLIVTRGSKMAEIIAIKTALELFIGLGWHVEISLVIEFNLCVALECLLKRNYRPTLWNLFIDIDCGINQLV